MINKRTQRNKFAQTVLRQQKRRSLEGYAQRLGYQCEYRVQRIDVEKYLASHAPRSRVPFATGKTGIRCVTTLKIRVRLSLLTPLGAV